MTDSLKTLYNQLILERQKDPTGFEKREDAQIIIKAYNPVCGDQFNLYLDFEGDTIVRASYHGYGCALSKASTSLLVQEMPGKSTSKLLSKIEYYYEMLKEDSDNAGQLVKALAMARNFPGREQCTVLSWEALKKYLENKPQE